MKRTCIHVLLVIGMTFSVVSSASAEGPIELGGKTAITANFGLTTLDQDDLGSKSVMDPFGEGKLGGSK